MKLSTNSVHQTEPSPGVFPPLKFLFLAAAIAATLFTAWTEPGLIPGVLTDAFTNAVPAFGTTPLPALPTITPRPSPRIGIVAGHYKNDSGAVCPEELGEVREVDINLSVATRVQANLKAEGYQVDLLSEFDDRLNGYNAVALVSIHADSCKFINNEATGFKVAAAMSTVYREQALRLIDCIKTRYRSVTNLGFHQSLTEDMTEYHAFDEIDPQTPAVIIEIGFMNLDYDLLTKRPDLVARGITDGILCYVRNEPVDNTNSNEP